METKIVPVKGHYEVYINGEFFECADSISEAEEDIAMFRMAKCYAQIQERKCNTNENYDLKL